MKLYMEHGYNTSCPCLNSADLWLHWRLLDIHRQVWVSILNLDNILKSRVDRQLGVLLLRPLEMGGDAKAQSNIFGGCGCQGVEVLVLRSIKSESGCFQKLPR